MKRFHQAAFEPVNSKKPLLGQMIWFGLWLFCTVIGAIILHPSKDGFGTHRELGLPACPSVVLFDRPCPGCGLTTSWTATLHGQLHTAFVDHPFGPILYFGFTATALLALYGYVTNNRLKSEHKGANTFLTYFLFVFLAFGIYRFATHPLHSPQSIAFWQDAAHGTDTGASHKPAN